MLLHGLLIVSICSELKHKMKCVEGRERNGPWNHPGCILIAPPFSGHVVRFVLVRMPPHGYIHCMPNGNVSFVMRLLPRHPGYVMIVCAVEMLRRERVVRSSEGIRENCILCVCRTERK